MALRLLVWGPHFEKHYPRELQSGTKLFGVLLVEVWDQQLSSKFKARLMARLFFLFSGFAALAAGDSPSAAHEPGGDVCLIYGSWRTLRDGGRTENSQHVARLTPVLGEFYCSPGRVHTWKARSLACRKTW